MLPRLGVAGRRDRESGGRNEFEALDRQRRRRCRRAEQESKKTNEKETSFQVGTLDLSQGHYPASLQLGQSLHVLESLLHRVTVALLISSIKSTLKTNQNLSKVGVETDA